MSTNTKDLFSKPSVQYQEQRVSGSSVLPDSAMLNNVQPSTADRVANNVNMLLRGYSAISKDYQKLLEVLKTRAKYLDLNLDIASLAQKDRTVSDACNKLYGGIIKKLSFDSYVDLLFYMQQLGTSISSAAINTKDPSKINAILAESMSGNQTISAAETLSRAYSNFLSENGHVDFLPAGQFVAGISNANGQSSSLLNGFSKLSLNIEAWQNASTGDTTTNPEPDSDISTSQYNGQVTNRIEAIKEKYGDKKSKELMKDLLADCIPCNLRNIDGSNYTKLVLDWLNMANATFFSSLQSLLNSKMPILNLNITGDLCALINLLLNFTCLPDIAALVAMFSLKLQRITDELAKLNVKILLDFSISVNIMGTILSSILNAAVNEAVSLMNSIIGSIECIITALQTQGKKVYLETATAGLAGYVKEYATDPVAKFSNELVKGKEALEAQIATIIDSIANILKQNTAANEMSVYFFFELNETRTLLALVTEIANIFMAVKKLKDDNAKLTLTQIIDYLCSAGIGGQGPWVKGIQESLNKNQQDIANSINTDVKDFLENIRIKDVADFIVGDKTGDAPDTTTVIDVDPITNEKSVIGLDESIPDDFFADDAADLMEEIEFQELLKNTDYSKYESLEQGSANFKFSDTLFNEYKSQKTKLLNALVRVNNKYTLNNTPLRFMPTQYIDFSNCYQDVGINNYSDSQMEEWINRVTN